MRILERRLRADPTQLTHPRACGGASFCRAGIKNANTFDGKPHNTRCCRKTGSWMNTLGAAAQQPRL